MGLYEHIDGVTVSPPIFSKDKVFRYRLEIKLAAPIQYGKTVCAVMQNPSYANQDHADKSVQCLEKVVFTQNRPEFSNVSHLIIVNQFALIQTNKFTGGSDAVGAKNDAAIQTALAEADIILLAWGKSNPFKWRQDFVLNEIKKLRRKTILQTKTHPSRCQYEGFIIPFVWRENQNG